MANLFARVRIIGDDESAVGVAAYIARANWTCARLKKRHRHARKKKELAFLGVFLPEDSPGHLHNPRHLWNAAEAKESVIDRKTGKARLRSGAQLARHMILALPWELDDVERHSLVKVFVHKHLVDRGVGVMAAIHRPDDHQGLNWHAHLLVTTRIIDKGGFGKKARHLNPSFSRLKDTTKSKLHCDNLPDVWRRFQNDWFRTQGLSISVSQAATTPGRHHGRKGRVNPEAIAEEEEERRSATKRRLENPEQLLAAVTRDVSTFTKDDLLTILRNNGFDKDEQEEVATLTLDQPGTKRLYDPGTLKLTDRFTSHVVWMEEKRILTQALSLHRTRSAKPALEAARNRLAMPTKRLQLDLQDAELEALIRAAAGSKLTLIPGPAGAGRMNAMGLIREDLESRRFRVIGLSPTNVGAHDLARTGFRSARNWQAELAFQEARKPGRPSWNNKTCVFIDEANLLDSRTLARIFKLAEATGARLVLAGDETTPGAAGRTGMFRVLRGKLGYAVPRDVRHQRDDWSKTANEHFADGRIGEAITTFAEHGSLHWEADDRQTRSKLVSAWAKDLQRGKIEHRFVFTGTRDAADILNKELQAARWQGKKANSKTFLNARGELRLNAGDRIQFHAAYPAIGIVAGMRATAIGAGENALKVRTDDGTTLTIDLRTVTDWGLGYAGTIYGTSAGPVSKVYLLYDDSNTWTADLCQAAFSRYEEDVELYIPRNRAQDQEALIRQISAPATDAPAHTWLIREDVEAIHADIAAETARHSVTFHLHGKARTLDLREPARRTTARRVFELLPMKEAVDLYRQVARINGATANKSPAINRGIDSLKRQLDIIANSRGFLPGKGIPAPGCISGITADLSFKPIYNHRLEPETQNQIDIRRIILDPLHVSPADRQKLYQRMSRFAEPVLQAIRERVIDIRSVLAPGDALVHYLHYANVFVKRIMATRSRDGSGKRRTLDDKRKALEKVMSEDALARVTRGFDDLARAADGAVALGTGTPQQMSAHQPLAAPRPNESRDERLQRLGNEIYQLERRLPRASALDEINILLDIQERHLQAASLQEEKDKEILSGQRAKDEQKTLAPVAEPSPSVRSQSSASASLLLSDGERVQERQVARDAERKLLEDRIRIIDQKSKSKYLRTSATGFELEELYRERQNLEKRLRMFDSEDERVRRARPDLEAANRAAVSISPVIPGRRRNDD